MEQTLENQPIYKANNKRNVLIGILVLSVASNFAQWLAVVSEPLYSAVSILTAIGYTVGTLIWCHIDAQERNINLGPGFRILLIVLGHCSNLLPVQVARLCPGLYLARLDDRFLCFDTAS